jgi:lipopolysaccharide/colanic/teichoic acid biosynthesis glycosyltransferase
MMGSTLMRNAGRAKPASWFGDGPFRLRQAVRGRRRTLGWKRGLDLCLALLLGVALGPLLLLIALVVRLSSRGPAIYSQCRVGQDGRLFTIYKFRTMIDKCESLTGPRWCIPGDPRVTPVGAVLRKLHLDELPQLWNILRGDMSFVGPRPERPEFVIELEQRIPGYSLRNLVPPGITGLAQLHLPADVELDSVRRKIVFDLLYLRRMSLLLDLGLMLQTVTHVLGYKPRRWAAHSP